jgi:hypothetical protein
VSDRGFFLTWHAVRRQLAAMPNDFYFVRLIHRLTRKPCPGERIWDAGQLARGSVVRFLRARNLQGHDIYLLPYAEHRNAGYIFLDLDHATPEILSLMRSNGHEPCVMLQTSPGHLQAWIRVSTTPLVSKLLLFRRRMTRWRGWGKSIGELVQEPGRRCPEQGVATVDQDATIMESRKEQALRSYEGERGYQPMLAVWAEMDVVLADEFRDGNVPG